MAATQLLRATIGDGWKSMEISTSQRHECDDVSTVEGSWSDKVGPVVIPRPLINKKMGARAVSLTSLRR